MEAAMHMKHACGAGWEAAAESSRAYTACQWHPAPPTLSTQVRLPFSAQKQISMLLCRIGTTSMQLQQGLTLHIHVYGCTRFAMLSSFTLCRPRSLSASLYYIATGLYVTTYLAIPWQNTYTGC